MPGEFRTEMEEEMMPANGLEVFDRTLQKSNLLLKEIEAEYGWEGRRFQSYAALRTVLHALRDRLTVKEASDFAAQLPLLIRGMFYEGWDPMAVPIKMDHEQFYERIRSEFQYSFNGTIRDLVATVLQVVCKHVTEGEMNNIASILPKHLSTLVKEAEAAAR
jgi:uncharacterized protein (DUF2267 family)